MSRNLVLVFLQVTCLSMLVALVPAHAELPAKTRWADPSSVRLEVEFPGNGYHATWELFRCDCGDLLVHSELSVPGEVEKGETLLVGGRAVLSRGFGDEHPELGASLDAPALMMQLTLSLLERSMPQGPSATSALGELSVEEAISPIHLDSGGAAGSFWAPWSVQGSVLAIGDSQRRFDLQFRFSTGNPGEELAGSMRLSGMAEYAASEFPLAAESPIQGWSLSWRDESDIASRSQAGVETLADLRKLLREQKD
jgi:hypothetical protein